MSEQSQSWASALGARLTHLKLHGALSNMASEDAALAQVCYEAALDIAPDIIVMVLAAFGFGVLRRRKA